MKYVHHVDLSAYPRSFGPTLRLRIMTALSALLYVSSGIYLLWGIDGAAHFWLWLCSAIIITISGIVFAISRLRRKLVLTRAALEYHDTFKTTRILRKDITGHRILLQGRKQLLEIHTATNGLRPVRIKLNFQPDEFFSTWFTDIHEATAATFHPGWSQESTPGIAENGRAQLIIMFFLLIALAEFTWAIVYPYPYDLMWITIGATPWLALIFCWLCKGTFANENISFHPGATDFTIPLLTPAGALFISSGLHMRYIHLTDWLTLAVPAILLGLILAGLTVCLSPKLLKLSGKLLIISLGLCMYSVEVIKIANIRLDRSSPEFYQASVLQKNIFDGKIKSYSFKTSPWGPFENNRNTNVSSDFYQDHDIGENICMTMHSGALGLAWYTVERINTCRPEESAQPSV